MSTTLASTESGPPFMSMPMESLAQTTEMIVYSPASRDWASDHEKDLDMGPSPLRSEQPTATIRIEDPSLFFSLDKAVSSGGRYAALRHTRLGGSGGGGSSRSDGRWSRLDMVSR